MKKLTTLLVVLLLLTLTACTSKPDLTLGEYEDNTYSNSYFGMSFVVPDDYTIIPREVLDELLGVTTEYLEEETDVSKIALKLSEQQTLYYTMVSQYPTDYVDGYNPNIIVQSENLNIIGKALVKNGEDYIEITKEHLKDMGIPIEFGDIETTMLDSQEFYIMTTISDYGVDVYQDYYVAIINDQALTFVATYFDDESKDAMTVVMDSIKFEEEK